MKSSMGNSQEEEEEYEDDFSSKKEGTSANKDGKNNNRANAMRSKHSVTEQRRRSKINERFQILRDLIPHGDQKRDTASFLLEVIEYVQLLQENVQKFEGSYQEWSTEPTKLMPWRHSHWRVQSLLGHPQTINNGIGSVPATTIAGNFDEKSVSINPSVTTNAHTGFETDSNHDDAFRTLDEKSSSGEKAATMPIPFQMQIPTAVRIDGNDSHLPQRPTCNALSTPCGISNGDQQEEHMIEGGTISISSAYSHGLLMSLTQALESSGVDLSEANISVRIDLGKRANQNLISGTSGSKETPVAHDHKITHGRDGNCGEEMDQPQKKLRS